MRNETLDLAADVRAPGVIYERATVTTSEAIPLPLDFKGNWITVQADGVGVHLTFGTATLTATLASTSTLTSLAISAASNASWFIPANEERSYNLSHWDVQMDVDTEQLWMAHISSAATGRLRFYRSSGA